MWVTSHNSDVHTFYFSRNLPQALELKAPYIFYYFLLLKETINQMIHCMSPAIVVLDSL